jgi:hypothetical protein
MHFGFTSFNVSDFCKCVTTTENGIIITHYLGSQGSKPSEVYYEDLSVVRK